MLKYLVHILVVARILLRANLASNCIWIFVVQCAEEEIKKGTQTLASLTFRINVFPAKYTNKEIKEVKGIDVIFWKNLNQGLVRGLIRD